MTHSTDFRNRVKTQSEKNGKIPDGEELPLPAERHAIQPRGIHLPPELIDLLFDSVRKLTRAELKLIIIIDGYVNYRGIGCYASAEHLAEKVDCATSQLRNCITRLLGEGILVETGHITIRNTKRRILETAWSRALPVSEEEWQLRAKAAQSDLTHRYGCSVKVCLHAIDKLPLRQSRTLKNQSPRTLNKQRQSNTREERNKESHRRQPAGALSESTKNHTFEMDLATALKDAFRKAGYYKTTSSMSKWVEAIGMAVKDVMKRKHLDKQSAQSHVSKIYRDHATHIEERYQPNIYTPWRMRDEFARLEKAYQRRYDSEEEETPKVSLVKNKNGTITGKLNSH